MDPMTSVDRCYCGTRDMHVGATSSHSSNGPSNISGPLLLPVTMAMGYLTSVSCCYHVARGMSAVPTSPNSSDGLHDIR
jgi:hypothetical protein